MNRYKGYDRYDENQIGFFGKILLIFMVIAYPMMVSIYPILPPLIGLVGYIIITNVNKNMIYTLSGVFYLFNLDLNLTLPMLLSLFIVVVTYLLVYMKLKLLIRCRVCLLFVLILFIDFAYYMSLFIYDFIFTTSTVVGDGLLIFYIVVDIFIGVFL